MSKSLYELDSEFLAILSEIEDSEDGELTDEQLERLEQLELDHATKLENYGKLITELQLKKSQAEGLHQAIASEANRIFTTQVEPLDNSIGKLKARIKESLEKRGEKKCKTSLFSFTVCNNSRPSVDVGNPDFLPDEYKKVKTLVMADTDKLIADWKQGIEPPQGVEIKLGNHLRIR